MQFPWAHISRSVVSSTLKAQTTVLFILLLFTGVNNIPHIMDHSMIASNNLTFVSKISLTFKSSVAVLAVDKLNSALIFSIYVEW